MEKSTNSQSTDPRAASKQSGRIVLYWSAVWAASLISSAAILKYVLEDPSSILGIAIAVTPILVSIGVVKVYIAAIKNMDELDKQIEVEALAAGFGAGIIVGVAGISLEGANLLLPWPMTQGMAMMMIVTKIAVQFMAIRKYR